VAQRNRYRNLAFDDRACLSAELAPTCKTFASREDSSGAGLRQEIGSRKEERRINALVHLFSSVRGQLVEYHHFGNKGLDIANIGQVAFCRECNKILFYVTRIVRFVIILGEAF